jgi:hypothetical protein
LNLQILLIKNIMNKRNFVFLCISTFIILFGCQEGESPLLEGDYGNNISTPDESLLIDPDITDISETHAQNVAKLFRQKHTETKAGTVSLATESTTPILDAEGTPLMYVVNFENQGGFTVVSATKSYYPVLAHADEGFFDCSEILPGVDMWVDDMKANILYCKENETSLDVSIKVMWIEYEKQMEAPKTKSAIDDLIATSFASWLSSGYSVRLLSDAADVIPASDYAYFTNHVNGYANPQYAYNSYVGFKNTYTNYTKGPLLTSTWYQGGSFPALIPGQPAAAGCGNIAIAQIMYYHKHPSTYNWNAMNPVAPTSSTQALIRDIYAATGSSGSITINDAKNALNNTLGYTCSLQTHSQQSVLQNISSNRPVYMRGTDSNVDEGHAWVCDGYSSFSISTEYFLAYVPSSGSLRFETIGPITYSNPSADLRRFYHHWGWFNGNGDGWYAENNVYTTASGTAYNPIGDRKNLINIAPN